MAGRVAVDVDGARQLASAMRQVAGPAGWRAMRDAHVKVARFVTTESKSRGGDAQQRRAGRALIGRGDKNEGYVAIRNMATMPFGIGAFLGAVKYKQFPEWVGNTWALEAGQGPYVIAPTIATNMDEIKETFIEMLELAAEALGLNWEG